jgi:hypothetical protein
MEAPDPPLGRNTLSGLLPLHFPAPDPTGASSPGSEAVGCKASIP